MPVVLIVDDSKTDRTRIAGLVSRWNNCDVVEATDGNDALRQIEQRRPDLVLTDLQMPELDGLELVRALKSDHPQVPVILLTGQGSETIAVSAINAGASSYVPKSQLAADLLPTLEQVYSTARAADTRFRLMHYLDGGQVSFCLPNDPEIFKACVEYLLDMLRCLPLGDQSERLRVGIALQEALENACWHGNLELPGSTPDADGSLRETAIRERRRSDPWSSRRIRVSASVTRERAEFTICDEGRGFDTQIMHSGNESPPTSAELGRGLTLMNSIMDSVVFNDTGNQVTMVRYAVQAEDELETELA